MRPTRHLTAGPLSLKVEGPDIAPVLGWTEVLARIQVSVRDGELGTLREDRPPSLCSPRTSAHGSGCAASTAREPSSGSSTVQPTATGASTRPERTGPLHHGREASGSVPRSLHSMIGAHYEAHRRDRTWQGVIDSAISPQKLDGDALQPMIQAFDRIRLDLQNGIAVSRGCPATCSRWRISATGLTPRSRPI